MKCSVCSEEFKKNGTTTLNFRRLGVVVTVTGVPATAVCANCGNAVLDWDVAKQGVKAGHYFLETQAWGIIKGLEQKMSITQAGESYERAKNGHFLRY